MNSLACSQRKFVEDFLCHSKRVLQCGFSYVFAHPECIELMNEKIKVIRVLECRMQRSAAEKSQLQQRVREAYIDYFLGLTRMGFKYISLHPEERGNIEELKKIFRNYDEMCRAPKVDRKRCEGRKAAVLNETFVVESQHESEVDWEDVLAQLQELTKKFDTIQGKLEDQRTMPLQRKSRPRTVCQIVSTEQTLKKFNKKLETKLEEIQMKKKQRMFRQKHNDAPSEVYVDSDQDSSEVMLSVDYFNQYSPKPSLVPPRVDRIERHLIIPIATRNNPTIKPRYRVTKSPVDGALQIEMNFEFEQEIPFQNRLVKNICIENNFPQPNSRRRQK